MRTELARVFDVCSSCRACLPLCSTFPTLFELLDGQAGADAEAGRMTPAEQDLVVGQCVHCGQCAVGCPYAPGRDDAAVDVPRLMLRATAMQHDNRITPVRARLATTILGRTDLVGRIATVMPPARRVAAAPPGSATRRLLRATTGLSSARRIPAFARRRWSARRRGGSGSGSDRSAFPAHCRVTVYPTCIVDRVATGLGDDVLAAYEHNGIRCTVSEAGCCGAPSLHLGDIDRFRRQARRTAATLAAEIRAGTDVVVAQPGCARVLCEVYPDHLDGPDAELVRAHVHDAVDHLWRAGPQRPALPVTGARHVAYIAPASSATRTSGDGPAGHALLALAGMSVTPVDAGPAMFGIAGFRADHDDVHDALTARIADAVVAADADAVAGDCLLVGTAVGDRIGAVVRHPLEYLAQAYRAATNP